MRGTDFELCGDQEATKPIQDRASEAYSHMVERGRCAWRSIGMQREGNTRWYQV